MIRTKRYSAKKIAEILGAKLIGKDNIAEYFSIDSRETGYDKWIFLAIKGENFDGEDFVENAIKNGAKIVITAKEKCYKGISTIVVQDTKRALFTLASYNKGKARVIGVTGSVGKTTVKELVRSVVSQKYKVISTYENNNNEIGVCKTLMSITDEEFCVLEMGMRGKNEIYTLADIARPEIAIITNAESTHIERLGSKRAIFDAKTEILSFSPRYALVPSERRFKTINYKEITPFFIGDNRVVKAKNIHLDKTGIAYQIEDMIIGKSYQAHIHSFYQHDVKNSLFAYMVGRIVKIPENSIINGIFEFENCKNRGEIIKASKIFIINDCYNASPTSAFSAIESLCKLSRKANKRPILIMGDMLELGKKSKKYHFKVGKFSRKSGIFDVLSCGEYSADICRGFKGGRIFFSCDEIVDFVCENFGENDIILIKASRGAKFEKIIEKLIERSNEN